MILMTQYNQSDAALGDACTISTECGSGNNEICDNGVCSCDTATHYSEGALCRLCEYYDKLHTKIYILKHLVNMYSI